MILHRQIDCVFLLILQFVLPNPAVKYFDEFLKAAYHMQEMTDEPCSLSYVLHGVNPGDNLPLKGGFSCKVC